MTYNIKADPESNSLLIVLNGLANEEDIRQIAVLLQREIKKLSFGFTIINDISALKVLKKTEANSVADIQQWLFQQGARRTIRVVGGVFAQAQFRITQQEAGAQYDTSEVATLEEAFLVLQQYSMP